MEQESDLLDTNALFDIRVESLVNALLRKSKEYTLDQVVVVPVGPDKRQSQNEVSEVRKKYYDEENVLYIKINKKGLFDTLPPGLFVGAEQKDYPSAKERTRAIKQQTKDARKFFLPFEQAIYHPRIEIDSLEQKWTQSFPDFIHRIWGLDRFSDQLDSRQLFLLCYLLPEAQRVVGNWALTGLCFEAVLQKPINLNWIPPVTCGIPEEINDPYEQNLGIDTILGDSFRDETPSLEVSVRGITYRELDSYLPGGANMFVLINLLYSYFLPLEINVLTKIIPTDDAWSSEFGRIVLGYNFTIK